MTQRKRSNYMKKADVLFAASIKARDGSCQNCGSTDFLQCAHLITRSYKSIRTDPSNAVTLCRSCHLRYTMRPLEWEDWVEERYPGLLNQLRGKALEYKKVDWRKEVDRLRGVVSGIPQP